MTDLTITVPTKRALPTRVAGTRSLSNLPSPTSSSNNSFPSFYVPSRLRPRTSSLSEDSNNDNNEGLDSEPSTPIRTPTAHRLAPHGTPWPRAVRSTASMPEILPQALSSELGGDGEGRPGATGGAAPAVQTSSSTSRSPSLETVTLSAVASRKNVALQGLLAITHSPLVRRLSSSLSDAQTIPGGARSEVTSGGDEVDDFFLYSRPSAGSWTSLDPPSVNLEEVVNPPNRTASPLAMNFVQQIDFKSDKDNDDCQ